MYCITCDKYDEPTAASLTDVTIRNAVKLWLRNKEQAISEYGHISQWDVSNVEDTSHLFENATNFNEAIGKWDVSNVKDMTRMFSDAEKFNQPIGDWNVSNVKKMHAMFTRANSFNQSLENWNVSNVTNMSDMFSCAKKFNQPVENWEISNVTDMDQMFFYATNFNQSVNWKKINKDLIEVGDFITGSAYAYEFPDFCLNEDDPSNPNNI